MTCSVIIPLQHPGPPSLDEAKEPVIEQLDIQLAPLPLLPAMPPMTAAFPGAADRGDKAVDAWRLDPERSPVAQMHDRPESDRISSQRRTAHRRTTPDDATLHKI